MGLPLCDRHGQFLGERALGLLCSGWWCVGEAAGTCPWEKKAGIVPHVGAGRCVQEVACPLAWSSSWSRAWRVRTAMGMQEKAGEEKVLSKLLNGERKTLWFHARARAEKERREASLARACGRRGERKASVKKWPVSPEIVGLLACHWAWTWAHFGSKIGPGLGPTKMPNKNENKI